MMSDYQEVFKRREIKYLLTSAQYAALAPDICSHLREDQYGLHTISNIYYDTDDYALIRASLEKPVYKEKLRLRGYGALTPDSIAFAEIKKKYKGVVYKRRAAIRLREAEIFLATGLIKEPKTQILEELAYFTQIHSVKPKISLSYDRVAMFDPSDSRVRLTFDRNIRFRETELSLACGDQGRMILPPDMTLMELKVDNAMPLWLARLLSENCVFPTSFSKYGRCYTQFILNKHFRGGSIIHVA